jgi:hypothetical protein
MEKPKPTVSISLAAKGMLAALIVCLLGIVALGMFGSGAIAQSAFNALRIFAAVILGWLLMDRALPRRK